MKICTKCKAEKPKSEFSKDSRDKSGLQSKCKSCASAYRLENLEKERDRARARYAVKGAEDLERQRARYAENPKKFLDRGRAYREANKDKISATGREYRAENHKRIIEKKRAYHAANPEKHSVNCRNRRARDRNADGKHTAADIRAIFDNQRGLCANCHTKLIKSGKDKYHVDHIIPIARGGSNWPSNLQCLCPFCNLSKNAKDPIVWARQNGRLL